MKAENSDIEAKDITFDSVTMREFFFPIKDCSKICWVVKGQAKCPLLAGDK